MTNEHQKSSNARQSSTATGSSRLSYLICCVTLAVLLVAGCASNESETKGPITASGFIEGQEVTVASEVAGRITEILVSRGDAVQAGAVMVLLDDAALKSQREEAEAGLSVALANLDRVQAGARAEEIAATRSSLAEVQARASGAEKAVLNAQDVISNPLSVDAQINTALTQIKLAEQNVELQEAELEETKVRHSVYAKQGGDVKRTWDLQLEASRAGLAQAEAQLAGARAYHAALVALRQDPLALKAKLHQAEIEHDLAIAEVARAQARLDELEAGPTEEEVALADAQVQQAQAVVRLVEARLNQLTLTAPMDGVVGTRGAQIGETATAGRPMLTIVNLDEVTLVLYIPENRIGQVRIGQQVDVSVDSFPERVFVGRVESIAGEAEFTPRNVQTKEERVNLVFAVDVSIPNPDHALKPGMPADAIVRP
ncbi:MAG: efflux RND transporter periplasmic adaptor subunit [Anaerolineae bacterium]|jgi:multidrug resistance efflux pump